jgi:hypothetical protein
MNFELQQTVQRLESGDSAQICRAIDDLHERLMTLRAEAIPPPPENLPDQLGEAAGWEDIDDHIVKYLKLLATYPFDPPLADSQRIARAVEAVLRGGSSAARALSLRLITSDELMPALTYLGSRGVSPESREEHQAGWLLSYLLDDVPTQAITLRIVRSWPDDPGLVRVVASVPEGMAVAGSADLTLPTQRESIEDATPVGGQVRIT